MDFSTGNTVTGASHSAEPKESSTQPQKQGYFTSILSSLPNLSLSTIKGESNKAQDQQKPQQSGYEYVDPYAQNLYGPPPGPPTFLATNAHDSPLPPTQSSPFQAFPAPPQLTLPPTTLPPSGGEFSHFHDNLIENSC